MASKSSNASTLGTTIHYNYSNSNNDKDHHSPRILYSMGFHQVLLLEMQNEESYHRQNDEKLRDEAKYIPSNITTFD
jgi:hypothetical protein